VDDRPKGLVLDTNVLVSGLLSPHGPPGRILALVLSGELAAAYDVRIMSEYLDVLSRPEFGFSGSHIETVLSSIQEDGRPVTGRPLPVALPDPSDEPFLEVAIAANLILVTGNLRHFPARSRSGALVLAPRSFLELLR
jgi:putative PIN family toxin of toxin-antitoxin system